MEVIFTYAPHGRDNGQDYNGGYTAVHAPTLDIAFTLFLAMHPRHDDYLPSFGHFYTEKDMTNKGITAEHFGKCHDHIIYAKCYGGGK